MTDTLVAQLKQLGDAARKAERGEKAFEALCAYEDALTDLNPNNPANYKAGGFKSRRHLHDLAAHNAYAEAKKFYESARGKTGTDVNLATVEALASNDYEEAYAWLLKTGKPLLDNLTYRPLGTTSRAFFAAFRSAHIDAARQKIRIARELAASGGDTQAGLVLIKNVIDTHLPRLGVQTIQPALAAQLSSNPKEIWDLLAEFTRKTFQGEFEDHIAPNQLLLNALKREDGLYDITRMHAHAEEIEDNKSISYQVGTPEYAEEILRIEGVLRQGPVHLIRDPKTYEGTGFTLESFEAELEKVIQESLYRYIGEIHELGKYAHKSEYIRTLEKIKDLRRIYTSDQGEATDKNVEYPGEDDWMLDVFTDFNYRSYRHFLDQVLITRARAVISNRTVEKDGEKPRLVTPAELYRRLLSAQDYLREARYPIHHRELLDKVGIKYDGLINDMRQTALYAANQEWSRIFQLRHDTGKKLDVMVGIIKCALMHVSGAMVQVAPMFTMPAVDKIEDDLTIRRVEEILADYQIGVGGDLAHRMLEPAFTMLEIRGMSLEDAHVQKRLGISAQQAERLNLQYKMLDTGAAWLVSTDEQQKTELRILAFKKFRTQYTAFSEEQKEVFRNHISTQGAGNLPISEVKRILGRQQMADAAAALKSGSDDAIYRLTHLADMADGLKANEAALRNDFTFTRMASGIESDVLSSRDAFMATMLGLQDRVVRQAAPLNEIFAPSAGGGRQPDVKDPASGFTWLGNVYHPSAELRLLKIREQGPDGARAFKEIETIAYALRTDGRSIMDADVLGISGFTPASLRSFMNRCALKQAWVHMEDARQAEGAKMRSFDDTKDHPYNHLTKAMHWMQMRRSPILSDRTWEDLGMSRHEFMAMYRGVLVDLKDGIQRDVLPAVLWREGPGAWLSTLNLLCDCYDLLGMEQEDRPYNDTIIGKMLAKLDSRISDHVLSMKTGETKTEASWSTKFKEALSIVSFGARVDPRFRDTMPMTSGALSRTLRVRMTNLFNKWDKNPGDPARGAYIARAILGVRRQINIDEFKWFTDLLTARGFTSFENFTERMAAQRIRQLATRLDVLSDMTGEARQSQIMDDIGRLRELSSNGLITEVRKNAMLAELQWPEDRVYDAYKQAAKACLPTYARQALQPALIEEEQKTLIEHCQLLAGVVGEGDVLEMKIDWKLLGRLHTEALQRETGDLLMMDGLRLKSGTLTEPLATRFDEIASQNPRVLSNARMMARMGLMDSEVSRVRRFKNMAGCYKALLDLRETHDDDLTTLYTNVINFYGSLDAAKIDMTDTEDLAPLGFESVSAFMNFADPKAFKILSVMGNHLQMADAKGETDEVISKAEEIRTFLGITKLDERYAPSAFMQNYCYTPRDVDTIERRHKKPSRERTNRQRKKATVHAMRQRAPV